MFHKEEENQKAEVLLVVLVELQSPKLEGLDSQTAHIQTPEQLVVLLPQQGPESLAG